MIVSKGVLKARMLEYFRKVEETREELIVTDNRVPVLKVIPILENSKKSWSDIFSNANQLKYNSYEDILSPETEEWDNNLL
jgi:hypothetical protein